MRSDYYESVIKNRERYHRAFALPTVLITSAVMMIILLVALTSVSSISVSLDGQYYNKLAREAGESGIAMAKACIAEIGEPTWSNSSPLHPNTDCGGGPSCVGGNQCYVLSDGNVKTSFTVGTPTITSDGAYLFSAKATTQLLRTSNGEVWKTYTDTISIKTKIGWEQLSTSFPSTCGVTLDSRAYCWGDNSDGQFGNGTYTSSNTPVAVSQGAMPAGATIKQISAGLFYTCAIASDNKAYCWGYNSSGQLGNGTNTSSNVPVAVSQGAMPAGATIKQISAGASTACAIASNNKAYCWGNNGSGQLGNGSTTASNTPVAVSQGAMPAGATVRQIAGGSTSCAIASNDKAYCWGGNTYGQLGNGTSTSSNVPVAVSQGALPGGTSIRQIDTTNYSSTCALASDSKAYCWGYNAYGQLGNGTTTNSNTPVAVSQGAMPGGVTIRQVDTSGYTTCAIGSDNRVYCWGEARVGKLGNGSTSNSSVPVAVSQGTMLASNTVQRIAVGAQDHICAIVTNSKGYCWGSNSSGQFGNGVTTSSSTPTGIRSVTDSGAVY